MVRNTMFDPDMEEILAKLDVKLPSVAVQLRSWRDQITKRSALDVTSFQVEQRVFDDQRRAERMRAQEIPQMFRQFILSGRDENGQEMRETAAQWRFVESIDKGRRLLFLWGEAGTGKSVIACQWLASEPLGLFVESAYLLSLSPNFSTDRGELERYEKTPRLVIDDLGRGQETDTQKSRIEEFLSRRYHAGLITVATTNKAPAKFCADYGERIASRLRELGALVHCDEQLRPTGRKELPPRRRFDDTALEISEEVGF